MKHLYLVLLLLLVPAGTASAQTPITPEMGNAYFGNCMKQPSSQPMSQQSQQALCACTAAHMTQFFTREEVQAMGNPNPAIARPAYNKMMITVYAPCMEAPTYEHYYNTCINNPETAKLGDPDKICPCMAGQIASHMKANSSAVFARLLQNNPNMMDPMAGLLADKEFNDFAQSNLVACVK